MFIRVTVVFNQEKKLPKISFLNFIKLFLLSQKHGWIPFLWACDKEGESVCVWDRRRNRNKCPFFYLFFPQNQTFKEYPNGEISVEIWKACFTIQTAILGFYLHLYYSWIPGLSFLSLVRSTLGLAVRTNTWVQKSSLTSGASGDELQSGPSLAQLRSAHCWDNAGLRHQLHPIKQQPNLNASSLSPSGWRVLGSHQGASRTRVGCMIFLEEQVGDVEMAAPSQRCPVPFCKWACAWPCAGG